MDFVKSVESPHLKKTFSDFGPGDTIKVHVRVIEGEKERSQVFQGIVINRRGSGLSATFSVRKISMGVGVERIFPMHSPSVSRIELVKKGRVRRAKLFYLRAQKTDRLEASKESLVAAERPSEKKSAPKADKAE
ncbi:MAG: 50S ribosomal protein L19 [Candidatus Eisenbacteria bacterium]|nr:50S ribosomal protein L19 [Candidatus Eisenbacteria bacterium]